MNNPLEMTETGQWFNQNKVRIYLRVAARSLFDKPALDLSNCEMWDNQGNHASGPNIKNMVTDAFLSKQVVWEAEVDHDSEEDGYSIEIDQIEIIGKNCLFEKVRLPGKSGKVKAKVKEGGEVGCESTYAIWFTLRNADGDTISFRLDPKLKGRTTALSITYLGNAIQNAPIPSELKTKLVALIEQHSKE